MSGGRRDGPARFFCHWLCHFRLSHASDVPGGSPRAPAGEDGLLPRSTVDLAVEALQQEDSLLEASAVADDHLRYA